MLPGEGNSEDLRSVFAYSIGFELRILQMLGWLSVTTVLTHEEQRFSVWESAPALIGLALMGYYVFMSIAMAVTLVHVDTMEAIEVSAATLTGVLGLYKVRSM